MNQESRIKNKALGIINQVKPIIHNSLFMIHFSRGFTFIELILYVSIVTIILVAVIPFAWSIIASKTKSSTEQEVFSAACYISERLKYEIRNATGVDPSSSGFSPLGVNLANDPAQKLVLNKPVAITVTHLGVNETQLQPSSVLPAFSIPASHLALIWIATDHYDLTGDPSSLVDSQRTWTKVTSINLTIKGMSLWKSLESVDTNSSLTINHVGGPQGTRSNWNANYYNATQVVQFASAKASVDAFFGSVPLSPSGSGAIAAAFIRPSTTSPPSVATPGPGFVFSGGEVFGVEIVNRSEFSPNYQTSASMLWDQALLWLGIGAELTAEAGANTIEINVTADKAVQINPGGLILNSGDTKVTDLTFTNYSSADNKTKHVGFTLTLESNLPGQSQEFKETTTLRSSAEMRNN